MAKTFYTERDIEDLARQGITALEVDDSIVLTDLARDKAMRLGIQLIRDYDKPPAAPERPYIAKMVSPSASAASGAADSSRKPSGSSDVHQRVRQAVIARLGDAVDQKLLDTIIGRVLQNIKT
ncbi:MAG: hypothetical protein FJ010_01530 [Chloroflexi bacterium]|nr:hypothetical protein [Chloroflexota bacterium]